MGGNGPVIVLADGDVDRAVECTAAGCYTNSGQICSASERILVHEAVHDEFVEKLLERTAGVTVGDPTSEDTDMGPLNNEAVAAKMDRHVADALERGAELLHGGGRVPDMPTDLYYEPTVLDGVTPGMAIDAEESFGPIAPITTVSDVDEAIEIANGIDLGLTSSVFTADLETTYDVAERLETGIVNVNESSTYWEKHLPFGGYTGKRSGVGRLGGRCTIEELTQLKTVIVDVGDAGDPS
jgi:succinate-semialdehyde dehydrogenase/glutarate-semialdehyde dehydrogenase